MKERMEDELWMRKLKERLEDYSEPLPASGWERLEKELSSSRLSLAGGRRVIPFRRWAIAAAAVLLVAVSSVSLWLLQSPMGNEVRHTVAPSLALAPDIMPASPPPAIPAKGAEPDERAQAKPLLKGGSRRALLAQQIGVAEEKAQNSPATVTEYEAGEMAEAEVVSDEKVTASADVRQDGADRPVERRRPSSRDKLHLPAGKQASSRSRGWAVGLSVGNTGGLISGNEMAAANAMQSSAGGKVDLSSMTNGILNVPAGQELVFKDGMPYLLRSGNQIVDIHHKQPLTFGFSVRKGLAKGFSVETGLTYTYLASDVEYARSTKTVSQKLHYLGIPLRANWNFVDKKTFTMYISAGGAVEKCVYGKIGSENETVKPIQLSVMGAVGAQYNISRRVGIYVEPGVSYFFDDGSKVETIRKENPCNFTLQGGVRLTY